MSIYSLETLTKEGSVRIAVELLGLFFIVTVAYVVVIESVFHSVAPGVYAQTGLDYSRTNLPDTASEFTHLLLSVVIVGSFLYWRLNFTETGQAFRKAILEDYQTDR